jgi:hypothetical protein
VALLLKNASVLFPPVLSDWITLSGGMPQGAWLGPLIFIILINDLSAECLMHKFLDDTTLSEVVPKGQLSAMQLYVVAEWSLLNHMNINFNKTKEMIIGTLSNSPPPVISINSNTVQRVSNFKLLGVTLDRTLKWHSHINLICNKASSILYFFKTITQKSR